MLVTGARIVDLDGPGAGVVCDILVAGGTITGIAPQIAPPAGSEVVAAEGRWAVPGLWDQHVHLGQWAVADRRIDLSATASASDVLTVVRSIDIDQSSEPVLGFGFRSAVWPDAASVRELDAAVGDRAAVLVSGDAHSAWLSSRALITLGLPARDGLIEEREWFEIVPAMTAAFSLEATTADYRRVVEAAHRRGIVGVVDLEFEDGAALWPGRVAAGIDSLRVRGGIYPERLDAALEAGLRSGDVLAGLVEVGPLKIISDGSLGTRTAYCCAPYTDSTGGVGVQNFTLGEMTELLSRAHAAGFEAAVHAIGDAALHDAVLAFEQSGARGSIEHAQLIRRDDLTQLARLGLRASVQPAHLLDDRDIAAVCWADRLDRCYLFASMQRAGVELALGSDAPVAPLDPWLAIDAAVRRTADERDAWLPGERLSARAALAASVDRQRLRVGGRGDVVLLDADPLDSGTDLRTMPVGATVVAGRVVHDGR
ncbi:amidohydrolase family protein [Epidermidibacterium keratini]|uniref:Amidohydrolase family protein n=2 Tax=Epidermidibacterium keratini TaxID=1891644 RepID=A0A7L4YTS0_9ACTN|nr:amidohydrolase family protein [Epidermidibacterium keratini]